MSKLRAAVLASLLTVFAFAVWYSWRRLQNGQLMQGYRVLHDTADPLPAFAACLFDREATEGEQEIYAREEAILDASYWNGKTSTSLVEEGYWTEHLSAVRTDLSKFSLLTCFVLKLPYAMDFDSLVHVLTVLIRRPRSSVRLLLSVQDRSNFLVGSYADGFPGSVSVLPDLSQPEEVKDDDDDDDDKTKVVVVHEMTYTFTQGKFLKRSTEANPCSSSSSSSGDLDFGGCVQDYLQTQVPHCRLTARRQAPPGLERCRGNDSRVVEAVAGLLSAPLLEIRARSGCQWACEAYHPLIRLDLQERKTVDANDTYFGGKLLKGGEEGGGAGKLVQVNFRSTQQSMPQVTEYVSYDLSNFLADLGSYLGLLTGIGLPEMMDRLIFMKNKE